MSSIFSRLVRRCGLLAATGLLSVQSGAEPTVLNGPMPGHSTMSTVAIWVQTSEPASVQIEYRKRGDESPETYWSEAVETTSDQANVAELVLIEGLRPGSHYDYEVLVDGKRQERRFREGYERNGPVPMTFQVKPRWRWVPEGEEKHSIFNFRVAAGSCNYVLEEGYDREGSDPYGSNHHIFESIYEKKPDLMLWLGDNIYYRENDFESRAGMIHRWTHDRAIPELAPLLANAHHFAIWDDHDYGPNDIGRSFPLKGVAREVFDLFWANPSAGLPETPGIFTFFSWGDANFYLLDNRTYLATATSKPESFGEPKPMLGREQVEWLVDQLSWAQSQMEHDSKSYPARWNIICVGNQVLSAAGSLYGYQSYWEEWQYLIDRIVEEGVDGVVFLTGDVHYSEVSQLEYVGGGNPGTAGEAGLKGKHYRLREITASPLTAGAWGGVAENALRLDLFDGEKTDRVGQNNFVLLDFKGPLDNRRMVVRFYDANGRLLNRKVGGGSHEVTDASVWFAKDLRASDRN